MKWNAGKITQITEQYTLQLVNVLSVNGTDGEVEIAAKIEQLLREISYFNRNPSNVWTKTVEKDALGRKSVFAFMESEIKTDKTILLHAHSDTVTIEDFGDLAQYANKPEQLKEKMKEIKWSDDIKKDLDSDDWMFGRGSLDMKSGMAIHLALLTYMAENPADIHCNILFMSNPIEETTHGGIIDALPELEKVKYEKNLKFICAINTDFVGPLYQGDEKRYIYLGSVGKLLPSFYIRGSETHVGQAFEGLDPNFIASELVRNINLNVDLTDSVDGEYTQPPVTLKMKDLKPTYNVQTPISSFVYFNYYVHQITPEKVLKQLKKIAEQSFETVVNKMNDEYKDFCNKTTNSYSKISWEAKVLTYDELYQKVYEEFGGAVDKRLDLIIQQNKGTEDPREVGRLMVEVLLSYLQDKSPIIVVFYATPYVPRNYVKNESIEEHKILDTLKSVLKTISESDNETFEVKKFFPSLTDSSYLCLDDTDEDIEYLQSNFPGMDELYPVPIQTIRKLNIPALNFGSWGKDAHKMTERVYKPYTFGVLPTLIYSFCKQLVND